MFYDTLLALCRQHGLTVSALARELGIAKGSPSNWQRGACPSSDAVARIARRFGVSADYLLGLDDVPSRTDVFCCTPEERRLVEALRAAPPDARAAAIASARAVLDALAAPSEDFSWQSG